MGLYRKFSEADIFELMDLTENVEGDERKIEIDTLFASFYGNSVFTIFYNDLPTLKIITDRLEQINLPREKVNKLDLSDYTEVEIEVEN